MLVMKKKNKFLPILSKCETVIVLDHWHLEAEKQIVCIGRILQTLQRELIKKPQLVPSEPSKCRIVVAEWMFAILTYTIFLFVKLYLALVSNILEHIETYTRTY